MLRVRIQLVPFGDAALARTIACAEIGNVGGDAARGDYRYRLAGHASRHAPALRHEGHIVDHARDQPVWALLRAVLDDWWDAVGSQCLAAGADRATRLSALLDEDGTVLEFAHGSWRAVRVDAAEWLLLQGGAVHDRWTGLDADAARARLLAVLANAPPPAP